MRWREDKARREVQSGFRLVQNDEIRIVQQRRREEYLLPHAL